MGEQTLPEGDQTPTDGGQAGETGTPEGGTPEGETPEEGTGGSTTPQGLKEAIGKELGKEFPDDETALKAVKDTFKYVGSAGKAKKAVEIVMKSKSLSEEDAVKFIEKSATDTGKPDDKKGEVDTSKFVPREEFEDSNFYNEKPELKPYKGIISTFRDKPENKGKSLSEIIETDEVLKETLVKTQAHDKEKNQKSVLHSNPRLGQVSDKMGKAKKALGEGDHKAAGDNAVGAVVDIIRGQEAG